MAGQDDALGTGIQRFLPCPEGMVYGTGNIAFGKRAKVGCAIGGNVVGAGGNAVGTGGNDAGDGGGLGGNIGLGRDNFLHRVGIGWRWQSGGRALSGRRRGAKFNLLRGRSDTEGVGTVGVEVLKPIMMVRLKLMFRNFWIWDLFEFWWRE
jgi:hypothetical protein